jgi:acyl-CoA synthetase
MNAILTTLDAARLDKHYREGHWQDDTLYTLLRHHAEQRPDSFAIRDRAARLTYRELRQQVDALAADLAARGVRHGQRVAVWLPSRVATVIILLACSRNAYVCCPSLHRDHTVGDIAELMTRMRCGALFAQRGYGADADRHDIFTHPAAPAIVYRTDTAIPLGDVRVDAPVNTDPNRVIYLAFTSGTTGAPKGVMHSDNTLLATVRTVASDWALTAQTVIYTLSPLSHNLGLGALVAAIAIGAELVVHELPRNESLLDRLIETGATYLVGVPTHAIDLLKQLRERGLEKFGAIKGFRISGAAASGEIIAQLKHHGVAVQSGYGMTETCSHHYTLPTDDPALISETSGRACAGYEVKIFRQDNHDLEAEPGAIGQIGGRGASLMLGYFDDQATTEASFNADGWFMTGDLGWMDAQGYLRITGRKKDLIIRGGHNIFPAKIEALAARHHCVEKVAAFAVPDERLGEKLCLAVVPRSGDLAGEDLLAHLDAQGLSKYDMPEFFLLLEEMPLTASGKILKRALADWVREGRVTPQPIRFGSRN